MDARFEYCNGLSEKRGHGLSDKSFIQNEIINAPPSKLLLALMFEYKIVIDDVGCTHLFVPTVLKNDQRTLINTTVSDRTVLFAVRCELDG